MQFYIVCWCCCCLSSFFVVLFTISLFASFRRLRYFVLFRSPTSHHSLHILQRMPGMLFGTTSCCLPLCHAMPCHFYVCVFWILKLWVVCDSLGLVDFPKPNPSPPIHSQNNYYRTVLFSLYIYSVHTPTLSHIAQFLTMQQSVSEFL